MNDGQGHYSQWSSGGQQPIDQPQWDKQPSLNNPPHPIPPQKSGGLKHRLQTETRAVKIGLGFAAFLLILSLCLCSLALAGVGSNSSSTSTTLSTPPSGQIVQANPTATAILSSQSAVSGCSVSRGISKNPDGSYHFSWLHVAGGRIVDEQNCPVTLVGFNTTGIEYGDGVAGFSATRIKIFRQTFNMNVWRLAISPVWWNANDYVPTVQMTYQAWVKQVIGWMEQNGNYVELDPTSYHTIVPAARGPFCADNNNTPPCWTSQDTPNNPPWTEQQMVAAAQQFWQSITPLYKNDPAILYDALNEPDDVDFPHFNQDLNLLINTIQADNPNALVFVYNVGIDQMIAGSLADYSQSNLVFTFHPYPDPNNPWQDKFARIQGWLPWIQSHNHGISIEEWGDPNLPSDIGYADAVLAFVKRDGAAATYFQDHNAIWGDLSVSAIGKVLQQEYASLPPVAGTTAVTSTLVTTPSPATSTSYGYSSNRNFMRGADA